jgi:hypothetical protein
MANRRITDLTALTAPATGDFLPIVDVSEALPADQNKKITYSELLASAPSGTAAAPSFSFDTTSSTGMYSPGTNQLALTTAGVGRLFVDATGRVGIGTTSPSYKLDISPDSAGAALRIRGGTSGVGVLQFTDNSVSAQWGTIETTNGSLDLTHSSVLRFYTASNERARIDSIGRLLVGSSGAVGDAYGGVRVIQAIGGNGNSIGVHRNDTSAFSQAFIFSKARGTSFQNVINNDTLGIITFHGANGNTFNNAAEIKGEIDGVVPGGGANDMPGRLVFSTTVGGTASPTERMRIKNNGIINFSNVPTYADNTTATAGGLVVGDVYKTALGVLMIRY